MHPPPATISIHVFGIDPGRVTTMLAPLTEANPELSLTVTCEAGVVTVHVRNLEGSSAQAHRHADQAATQAERLLGPFAFGRGSRTIQESLVRLLKENSRCVVTAESCTGGLVGKMITDVPGSSAVYEGGWIVYADATKASQLGVLTADIEEHGVVSGPVATAMAKGALVRSGADLSVSVTGIAGPEGGTDDKPVGTVWFGVAQKTAGAGDPISGCVCLHFQGSRDAVRDLAAKTAVGLLRFTLLGVCLETMAAPEPRSG